MGVKYDNDAGRTEMRQMVVFAIGSKEYAVDILAVREVTRPAALTPMPGRSELVDGLMTVGEEAVPVINLRRALGEASGSYDQAGRIIITQAGDKVIGLAVDAVNEIIRLGGRTPYKMDPPSGPSNGRHLCGIVRIEDRCLHILDIGCVVDEALTGSFVTGA